MVLISSTEMPLYTISYSTDLSIFSQILVNTYQAPIRCIISGEGEISSSEWTTQGDPLAMAMYVLVVNPLIDKLHDLIPLRQSKFGMLTMQLVPATFKI